MSFALLRGRCPGRSRSSPVSYTGAVLPPLVQIKIEGQDEEGPGEEEGEEAEVEEVEEVEEIVEEEVVQEEEEGGPDTAGSGPQGAQGVQGAHGVQGAPSGEAKGVSEGKDTRSPGSEAQVSEGRPEKPFPNMPPGGSMPLPR